MNLNILKSFIPVIISKIGDVNELVSELLGKEQVKHNDLFVYLITKENERTLLKAVTIDDKGLITETKFIANNKEVSEIEVSELLKNLLSNV